MRVEGLNPHFLNNVIIIKTKVLPQQAQVVVGDFGYPFEVFWLTCSQNLLNYFAFQFFDFERT